MIIFFLVYFLIFTNTSKILFEKAVYEKGESGYNCFRIPAIVRNPKTGILLAFAEGRKYSCNDHGYVDIVVKRSLNNGSNWSELKLVYHYPSQFHTTVGNPVPVYDVHGMIKNSDDVIPLVLVFSVNNSRIFHCRSDDDGNTFSPPVEITDEVKLKEWNKWYATGPAGGIEILTQKEGKPRILIPCNHGPGSPMEDTDTKSHVIYTDDGENWKIGGIVPTATTNECSLALLKNGSILISMRNHLGNHNRAFSVSNDDGLSFSKAIENKYLPDPQCEAAILSTQNNNVLVFSNPSDINKRENMCIHRSDDQGFTWKNILSVNKKGSQYSSLVDFDGNRIGLLYEKSGSLESFKYLEFVMFQL